MTTDKLLPCPFCDARVNRESRAQLSECVDYAKVFCTYCHASTKEFRSYDPLCNRANAIMNWNIRSTITIPLPDAEALVENSNDGLKTTSDNGFHYQCKICGGNPTSFPYAPDPKMHSPAVGGKIGTRATEQAAKVPVADQGVDNSISDMIMSIAKGNPTMDNLTLRIVAVLHRHTKPERCVDTVRFGDAKEIAEAIVEEVKLTSSGRESNEAARVDAPTPIGKYSGQHPRYEHRRIIGYLYDDKWPQLYQLPDDPLRTSQPAQPVSLADCAMALQGNERIKLGSDLQVIAKTVLDAAGVPYVE